MQNGTLRINWQGGVPIELLPLRQSGRGPRCLRRLHVAELLLELVVGGSGLANRLNVLGLLGCAALPR